jgi:hypothetical protein
MFVKLLSSWSSDDNPVEFDGMRYGPFASKESGDEWLETLAKSGATPHTLEDLYVGSVVGDMPRLCLWDGGGGPSMTGLDGVDPLTDAGRPIVLAGDMRRSLSPKTIVLIDGARRGQADQDRAAQVDE